MQNIQKAYSTRKQNTRFTLNKKTRTKTEENHAKKQTQIIYRAQTCNKSKIYTHDAYKAFTKHSQKIKNIERK